MRALSYKQPWAYLVASGIKPIENRTWKLPEKYKGQRVLIHASAAKIGKPSSYFTDKQWMELNHLALNHGFRFKPCEQYSSIIGSVEFIDCVQNHPSIWAEHEAKVYSKKQDKEIIVPVWNWVTANPVLFAKPITNVKGKLSFWEYGLTEESYLNMVGVDANEDFESLPKIEL